MIKVNYWYFRIINSNSCYLEFIAQLLFIKFSFKCIISFNSQVYVNNYLVSWIKKSCSLVLVLVHIASKWLTWDLSPCLSNSTAQAFTSPTLKISYSLNKCLLKTYYVPVLFCMLKVCQQIGPAHILKENIKIKNK